MTDLLSRLAVALGIGLLVGLERGWRTRDAGETQRAAGLRTFALSGLLGGFSGAVAQEAGPVVLGFIFLAFTGAFTAFHWLEARTNKDVGATTVVAGLLTFVLGAYALLGNLQVAVAGAVAMTLALALREPLHQWVATLRWEEIRAALILLAMTFLLLPVLPDRTIDPWDAINPAEIWLIAIMIAAISFGGYVAVRLFGDRLGILMAGAAGGLASSTATTLTLARLARGNRGADRLLAGGILVAGAIMVVRVGVIAFLLNRALALQLLPALVAMGAVLATGATMLLLRRTDELRPEIEITNPLELGTAIKMALVIVTVIVAVQLVQGQLGAAGVLAVALVSGIADVDAINISMARLAGHQVAMETAVLAVVAAVAVNGVAKAVMAGWVGGTRIGLLTGAAGLLATGAALMVLLIL